MGVTPTVHFRKGAIVITKTKPPTIVDSIFTLLADGVPRTAMQIGTELQESVGCSPMSVESVLSARCKNDRRFIRTLTRGKRFWTLTNGGRP